MAGPRVKTASLDLIAEANNKPTTDQAIQAAIREHKEKTAAELDACPVPLNARQRRNLRKLMEKAGKDFFGNPLNQEGSQP